MSGLIAHLIGAEKDHAKYSASGSKRWLECDGSSALIEKAPEPAESPYAKEGTRAHGVLEFLIKNRAKRLAAAAFLRKNHPLQMVIHAEATLAYVEDRLRQYPGAELEVEIRCDLPVSEKDQFGTTDIAIIEHFGRLIVMDYKYGAGIPVFPDENSQLIYYALGLAHQYDYNFSEVELVVIQPRRPIPVDGKPPGAPEETIRSWLTTVENLMEWREKFEAGIQRNKKAAKLGPEKFLKSGDHCRFCPAAVICPEIKNQALRKAQAVFDDESGDLTLPAVNSRDIAPEKLSTILPALEKLDRWISAVREYAESQLEKGVKIPGWALVEKRGSRKWNDIDQAELLAKELFGKKAMTKPEILSPAQLEKLSPKAKSFVDKFSSTVSSGLTLGRDKTENAFKEKGASHAVKTKKSCRNISKT